jgi:hypothetical protein
MMRRYATLFALMAACLMWSCSSPDEGTQIECDDDQLYDHVDDVCVDRPATAPADAGGDVDAADSGEAGHDSGEDSSADTDAAEPDVSQDVSQDGSDDAADGGDVIDMEECDKDNDGAIAESCGGYDCDDNDPRRSPYLTEICDGIDNNCSGVVNDNIDCTFYAHSGTTLYKVDPFEKSANEVGAGLPNLLDIDTHPDGTLFGVSFDGLYRFDPWADDWVFQGDFGASVADPNGLAIDSDGTAFITSEDDLFSTDLHTGQATLLGSSDDFYSSGDCVVDKRDTLFVSSKHLDDGDDVLVQLSRSDGQGTQIGPTGFDNIFGLTAAWGTLYGLTSAGELIEIDRQSGQATLVHTFPNITFYGAASTPGR